MSSSSLTLDKLAVNKTHSNNSPILLRNSSTWGLFNTYTWEETQKANKYEIHSHCQEYVQEHKLVMGLLLTKKKKKKIKIYRNIKQPYVP